MNAEKQSQPPVNPNPLGLDELRIKVAELCGFTEIQKRPISGWDGTKNGQTMVEVPDFPRDLNAIHEAEKMLTEEQCECYFDILNDPTLDAEGDYPAKDYVIHATAEQRCRAFVATMEDKT